MMKFGQVDRIRLSASMIALTAALALPATAYAQDATEEDEIVVTGIRGSLQRAMDIKRESSGVVDAISAEDIGDFPDTNLAESLQRITGVSINRVNGEGSEVTVRGFGAGYNLVTLNNRTMPTANVAIVGGDQSVDFATGTTRSFDFSNLASEGVSSLEVYKTGRAAVASGGIGATINVSTLRPLENPGLRGSLSAKAMHDTGVDTGSNITPELSGLFSWTNDSETFGISLFGGFSERDGSSRSGTVNEWNIIHASEFASRMAAGGTVTGLPADPDALVAYPNDSRYHLAESHRERLNGQLTVQFRPMDNLTLTGDYTYANNQTEEQRTDQTNWFAQGFNDVIFEENSPVATAVYLQQDISGVKDIGFEQQYRALEDTLESIGFNAEWNVSDNFTVVLDAHSSTAKSLPNNPMGASSTLIGLAANVVDDHSLDFRSGFPVQDWTFNDASLGNNNGVLDDGDLGSTIGRTNTSSQEHQIDEISLDAAWETAGGSRLDFGVSYRTAEMIQHRTQTQQTLGNWSTDHVGDVNQFAAGLVEEYCLGCLFDDLGPGDADIAFRGNAVSLYEALSAAYLTDPYNDGLDHSIQSSGFDHNEVREDVLAAFVQFSMDGEFLDRPSRLVAGVRYEQTEVESTSLVAPVTEIRWVSDNDFSRIVDNDPANRVAVTLEGSYTNVLPSFDFSVDVTDNFVARISASRTLARAGFGSLFASDVANAPPRPTFFGGIYSGTSGNPNLLPLESDNFDVSFEWYYGEANYLSFGFYEKRVANFEGRGQTTRNLFGLRDPSSGAPGSRSGDAVLALQGLGAVLNEENLFTMTALIDNRPSVADATAEFQANMNPDGTLPFAYMNGILTQYDLVADANDPLIGFEVTQPINNREARIYGIEIAGQHFFGDSGFGVAASYTSVDGDVQIDVAADPTVDQFALIGLSDTYNVTGIFEKYGLSARLVYNWRDEYLAQTNRGGGNRNPVFVEAFGQLDLAISYDLTDQIQLSFEGINLTEEGVRTFARDNSQVYFAQELDARYLFGARYRFN